MVTLKGVVTRRADAHIGNTVEEDASERWVILLCAWKVTKVIALSQEFINENGADMVGLERFPVVRWHAEEDAKDSAACAVAATPMMREELVALSIGMEVGHAFGGERTNVP